MMSFSNTNLLKLWLLSPILVSARPGHQGIWPGSDSSGDGNSLATPKQITPYQISWPYPDMPPQYQSPPDPRNAQTRWGNPVAPQQPDHTRGFEEVPAGEPTKRPGRSCDWWKGQDADDASGLTGVTSLACFNYGESGLVNEYGGTAKLPTPIETPEGRNDDTPTSDPIRPSASPAEVIGDCLGGTGPVPTNTDSSRVQLLDFQLETGSARQGTQEAQDGQIHAGPLPLICDSTPRAVTHIPDGQVQTRSKRNSHTPDGLMQGDTTEAKYTLTETSGTGPTDVDTPVARSPKEPARTSPTKRRKMQSMIDEMDRRGEDSRLSPELPGCFVRIPELLEVPLQPLVGYAAYDAPSQVPVVQRSPKGGVGVASAQSPTPGAMDRLAEAVAPAAAVPSHRGRLADNELYQDLSAQTLRGSNRVKIVCLVWVLVFVLLGILEFL